MNKSVLISVVIPAYNRADIIGDCINSVLNQTYRNIEIIVVDDNSSDNTALVVDEFSGKDSRVRPCVRCSENHGACYARNLGASLAKGEIIAFQDSDDIWKPEKLRKQLAYLKRNNYDLVFCGMERINNIRNTSWYFPRYDYDETKPAKYQIMYENPMSTQCIMVRKSVFEKVRFDDKIRKFQDWDFAIRVADVAKIGYLHESLVESTVQQNSISQTVSRIDSLWVIYRKYKHLIVKNSKIHARFYMKFADELADKNKRKALEYYRKSLNIHFRFKVFVKMMLCVVK